MNEKQLKDAVDFNANQLAAGKLTAEDQAWLVEYFQRFNRLKIDGKAGSVETIPALRKWIESVKPPVEHASDGSAYFPPPPGGYASDEERRMEGGPKDRRGRPLQTLQGFLRGDYVKSPLGNYVSCAMDPTMPYGMKMRIPELSKKYGVEIEFRCVDTGKAFIGKGWKRIDVCVEGREAQFEKTVNGPLTLVEMK